MQQTPDDDRWGDLMRAAIAGDQAAYRLLLGELAQALRARVRSLLARGASGNAEVEDIVQETLLAVHLKRDSWTPALPFRPWVNAVARYKLIDSLRRHGRRQTIPIEDLENQLEAPAESSDDRGDAEKLILQLSPRARRIVRALTIEDMPMAQLAREMGMSEGAVRVALHRALKELRRLYQGNER